MGAKRTRANNCKGHSTQPVGRLPCPNECRHTLCERCYCSSSTDRGLLTLEFWGRANAVAQEDVRFRPHQTFAGNVGNALTAALPLVMELAFWLHPNYPWPGGRGRGCGKQILCFNPSNPGFDGGCPLRSGADVSDWRYWCDGSWLKLNLRHPMYAHLGRPSRALVFVRTDLTMHRIAACAANDGFDSAIKLFWCEYGLTQAQAEARVPRTHKQQRRLLMVLPGLLERHQRGGLVVMVLDTEFEPGLPSVCLDGVKSRIWSFSLRVMNTQTRKEVIRPFASRWTLSPLSRLHPHRSIYSRTSP